MRIFGREPAVLIGLLEAAIAFAITIGLPITGDQVGLIMAFVTAALGLFVAWRTQHTTLAVIVGLTKAALALLIGFGLPLTAGQTATLIALVVATFGFFNRTQTSPVPVVTRSGQVAAAVVVLVLGLTVGVSAAITPAHQGRTVAGDIWTIRVGH